MLRRTRVRFVLYGSQSRGQSTTGISKIPVYAANIASLLVGIATNAYEKGNSFGVNTSNGQQAVTPMATGSALTAQVPMPATYSGMTILGSIHTHPNSAYNAPSPGDVYMLAAANKVNPNFTTAFALGSNGSKYALVVTNPTQLAAFVAAYPKSTNMDADAAWRQFSTPSGYFNSANNYINPSGAITGAVAEQGYEYAQAYVLQKMNTGVALLKADANGNFHQMQTVLGTNTTGPTIFFKFTCY